MAGELLPLQHEAHPHARQVNPRGPPVPADQPALRSTPISERHFGAELEQNV